MGKADECAESTCREFGKRVPNFKELYGIDISLCDKHALILKTKQSSMKSTTGAAGQRSAPLNPAGILVNAWRGFATMEMSGQLASIMALKTGVNYQKNIEKLIDDAPRLQEDLIGDGTIGQMVTKKWWRDFFKIAGLRSPEALKFVADYVSNRISSISESINEQSTLRRMASNIGDFVSSKASGFFGRKKNSLVAKLAIEGVCKFYEMVVAQITKKHGVSFRTFYNSIEMFQEQILPIMAANGNKFSQEILMATGEYDQDEITDMLQAYELVKDVSDELKAKVV